MQRIWQSRTYPVYGLLYIRLWWSSLICCNCSVPEAGIQRLVILVGHGNNEVDQESNAAPATDDGDTEKLIHLGRILRGRHFEPDCQPEQCMSSGFADGRYRRKQVRSQSKNMVRSLNNANALLAGLFPSEARDFVSMPIPVHAVADMNAPDRGDDCQENLKTLVKDHIDAHQLAALLVHSTRSGSIQCMLESLGYNMSFGRDASIVLTVEVPAMDKQSKSSGVKFSLWSGSEGNDHGEQWEEFHTDTSMMSLHLSRRLDDTCQCATECARKHGADDASVLEISEKALIGIIVGLTLGPFALGVLALQIYRLRHTRHY